jgi:hypothetical protein
MTAQQDDVQAFAQKWLAYWPEQNILTNFVPKAKQPMVLTWFCLLFELHECMFALEHEPVREQKSLWWSQELQTMQKKTAQHPLAIALQHLPVAFNALSQPMLQLSQQTPIRASNTQNLFFRLQPLSEMIAQLEQQLFGGELSTHQAISAQLLLMRLPHGVTAFDQAMIPMHLLARHQCLEQINNTQALMSDWLAEIATIIPAQHSGNGIREAQTRFTQRRLKQLQSQKLPHVQFGHTWDAWRSMRMHHRV